MQTSHAAKEANNHKERLRDHLDEDGRRLKKDAQDATNHLHGDLNSMARAVGGQVREFVDQASRGVSHAKDSVVDAGGTVAETIRENPIWATGIALTAGVVLGAFLRRR
jgi:ElaB/YqjD/DUF883 family membrane-anchored ribosome-binding protein